jgi:hypothetical protein
MKYLLFILFLLFGINVYATDINWSLEGTASASGGSGSASSVNDNNTSTNYYEEDSDTYNNLVTISYTATVMFEKKADRINSVNIYHYGLRDYVEFQSFSCVIQLYYASAWHTVKSLDSSVFDKSNRTDSQAGTWNNVEGIRFDINTTGKIITGAATFRHRLYELRAFGPENSNNYVITFY